MEEGGGRRRAVSASAQVNFGLLLGEWFTRMRQIRLRLHLLSFPSPTHLEYKLLLSPLLFLRDPIILSIKTAFCFLVKKIRRFGTRDINLAQLVALQKMQLISDITFFQVSFGLGRRSRLPPLPDISDVLQGL